MRVPVVLTGSAVGSPLLSEGVKEERNRAKIDFQLVDAVVVFFLFSFFFHTPLLSSFWTSRVHRCRLFSPPVLLPVNFHSA